MENITLGSFLLLLTIVIFIPAIIVHFTLGRNGGHHLYDKLGLSQRQIRDLPIHMLKKRLLWNTNGSLYTFIGLLIAMIIYPLGCLVGLPVNKLGLPDTVLISSIVVSTIFLILLWRLRTRLTRSR